MGGVYQITSPVTGFEKSFKEKNKKGKDFSCQIAGNHLSPSATASFSLPAELAGFVHHRQRAIHTQMNTSLPLANI